MEKRKQTNSKTETKLKQMRFHLNGQTIRFYPLTQSQNCVRIEYRIVSLIAPPPQIVRGRKKVIIYFLSFFSRMYYLLTTVTLHVDWSVMIYSRTGSSTFFVIFGCMTSNFLSLIFSTCLVLYK